MIRCKNTLATLGIATLGVASLLLIPTASAASAGTHQTAVAKLFSGTAQVELREHFAGEAVLAGLVGTNAANLQDSIAGETWEHTTMYPGFATQATADNCPAAAALFTEIAADEGGHAAAYTVALQALTDSAVKVPKPQTVDPVVITASTPACTGQTQVNLLDAMHGEAFAYAKYTAYALQAARTHQTALAKLFSGTAQVELQEHFAAEAVLAGLVGTNAANLQESIKGETWEHETMYPGFAAQADTDNCPAAAALFTEIAVDEGGHAAAYTLALQALTDSAVKVPKPQTVDPVVITASTPACTGQTQVNLLDAMHGEAFAYAKYTAYALQAARTHQTAVAKLFSGTAQVELQEHFAAEAVLAGLVGTNAANLQESITGETWQHTTMYPGFATQATTDGCTAAAALFTEIAVDEGGHAAAYTLALKSLTNPKVKVPKPQTVDPVVITASTPACPGTKTQDNLLAAMHGEAFAYAKYTAYALQAVSYTHLTLPTI